MVEDDNNPRWDVISKAVHRIDNVLTGLSIELKNQKRRQLDINEVDLAVQDIMARVNEARVITWVTNFMEDKPSPQMKEKPKGSAYA